MLGIERGILCCKTSLVATWEGATRKLRIYKGKERWSGESGSGLFYSAESIGAIKIQAEVGAMLMLCASQQHCVAMSWKKI